METGTIGKQEIYDLLHEQQISYEVTEHGKVYNMAEMDALELPHKEFLAKNLFVRDDKKQHFYLISMMEEKHIDLKSFSKTYQTRRLSFANEQEMLELLGVTPGAVTPFGLLNDKNIRVQFFLDKDFMEGEGLIGIHPNENTATVWIHTADLLPLIKGHGNEVQLITLDE